MLSSADKKTILKTVSLFATLPDRPLEDLAALMAAENHEANVQLFAKGDLGYCMFIIVSGGVRIHDEGRTLAQLGSGAVFGEMALLDTETRSAAANTTEPSLLLRLDQKPFYALMQAHPAVSQEIIAILCRRMRSCIDNMAQDYQYILQMERLTAAAAALEVGTYRRDSISTVTSRNDALGQLARVFARMADEIMGREARLQREVQQLRIEIDQAKRAQQVSEITESDYFQNLQKKAQAWRKRRSTSEQPSSE